MAGLAALKNFIRLYLTPNNELNIELIQSMPLENVVKLQKTTQQLIDRFEMEPFSENVDRTMYLDRLYKIRNALEIYMRNRMAPASASEVEYDSDATDVIYGGIHYKRRSKKRNRRTIRRTSRRNKRSKRNKRFSRRP